MLAPVGVSVYTRIEHFKRAIEALKRNTLAIETNLVIYSDAASKDDDIELVSQVRTYAKNITGFKTVTVIERSCNYGGVKNAHEGLKQLVRIFKKAICVEDDIETAPGFLTFMNDALTFYQHNPNVTSISGYSPPIEIDEYVDDDFYVMNRFCGWGCGVYERTMEWLKTKISQEEFDGINDKSVLCEFGDDVLNMVKREVAGEIDAADVRCMFRQALNQTATIYPKFSLVQNLGHDGSGFHCGKTNRFRHEQLWNKTNGFSFKQDFQIDQRIKKEQQDFRSYSGNYLRFKTIHNQKQSKEIALSYIGKFFSEEFNKLSQHKSSKNNTKTKVALLSTPRVGSTWLSHLLTPYFGASIHREWLHKRFVETFLKKNPTLAPIDYLDFLNQHAFASLPAVGLHFHVNQYRLWMDTYGIDLFEYFNFDHVVYMQRDDRFAQTYSYAVASESGLWGSEIIEALNISDNFKVKVNKKAFELAYKAVNSEIKYFEKHLLGFVTKIISYENLKKDQSDLVNSIFEKSFKLTKNSQVEVIESTNKSPSIVCTENRSTINAFFNTLNR